MTSKSWTEVLFLNTAIFLICLLITEIIFGYWFSEFNLGPYMREHRLKKNPVVLIYNNKTYNFTYKRNYYGFRGKEVDPSQIEAVIIGGSTTDERYKPRELTITGNLNALLKERGYKFNIVNAGIEGQSTYGHIYNFKHWFPRLKDFSPKLYIFYIGINDQGSGYNKIEDNLGSDGHVKNPELLEVFFDNFKSKSFFYDKLRILKQKYYTTGKKLKYDHNFFGEKDISNYKYINFKEALEIHDVEYLKYWHQKRNLNYLHNVEILNNYAVNNNAIAVFVNQVSYDGLKDENLFILNYLLIEYCKKKNLYCIDLAKKLDGKLEYWFDNVHTTELGSKIIARTIIDELVSIIEKENLF